MSYFDHVLMFKDRDEALKVLAELGFANVENEFTVPTIEGLRISVPTGGMTKESEGCPSEPIRFQIPGFFLCIALEEVSDALIKLDNAACRLISDRDAFTLKDGSNYFMYLADDLDQKLLTIAHVEPVFAGSEYPFGV